MAMSVKWNFIIAVACLNSVCCKLTLELTNGKIKGQILMSRAGRPYYSYTGLPYAKPPVGELRFKAPEPADPWNGTLDATKKPNICAQPALKSSREDCLYLNVYSPATDDESLPVMFWIHGGGFAKGHSGPSRYGPDYFMDKDVILVTVNYRLNIFGFLSTEDDTIPGNFGMKDQVAALRWVRDNVAAFNGDPSRVTIFGGSTGSACVGLHMLSPMSKGLFHKAILQSGTPTCRLVVNPPGFARERARSVFTATGCNFGTSENALKCLQRLPAEHLTFIHDRMFLWLNYPLILFKPVVESCSSYGEGFLCHHPIYDFKQESFVPVIFGLNGAEGGMFVASLYNETSLIYDEFKSNFNYMFSVMVDRNTYYERLEQIDEIGKKALEKYFPSGKLADNTHLEAVKLFGDAGFTQCIFDMAYRISSPKYGYFYDYQNEYSYNKLFGSCEKPLGVTHGDELNSLFKITDLNPKALNEKDLEVSKLMVNIWYKFVASDNPTIDGKENGSTWPTFTRLNQLMISVNSSCPNIIQNPFVDRYKFWNGFPISKNRFCDSNNCSNDALKKNVFFYSFLFILICHFFILILL